MGNIFEVMVQEYVDVEREMKEFGYSMNEKGIFKYFVSIRKKKFSYKSM